MVRKGIINQKLYLNSRSFFMGVPLKVILLSYAYV